MLISVELNGNFNLESRISFVSRGVNVYKLCKTKGCVFEALFKMGMTRNMLFKKVLIVVQSFCEDWKSAIWNM